MESRHLEQPERAQHSGRAMTEDRHLNTRTGPLRLRDALLSLITDDEQGPVFCRADVREDGAELVALVF